MEELYINKSHTIAWGMNQVGYGRLVLPLIQRKFVWNDNQILSLFDSVLQGFPISAILLNRINKDDKNLYYGFLKNVKQDGFSSQTANVDKSGEVITYSVLDGQQRLTALRVCFDSECHFIYHPKYSKKDEEKSKYVYICLSDPYNRATEESEYRYRIKMLEKNDDFYLEKNQNNQLHLWVRPYKIIDIFNKIVEISVDEDKLDGLDSQDEISSRFESEFPSVLESFFKNEDELIEAKNLFNDKSKEILETSMLLFNRYYLDKNILNCVMLNDPQSDNVTDVFIRLNTGGTKLSYSDLLVTKLSSYFETQDMKNNPEYKDAKKRINETILNKINPDVRPNDESILKTFLVLNASNSRFGIPEKSSEVSYSKNIGFSTIAKIDEKKLNSIHSNWNAYARCIVFTYNFLHRQLGFGKKTLKSYNAVIPIILYFWFLGVDNDTRLNDYINEAERTIAQKIKWYLYMVLLKNIFGSGSGDTILASVCEKMHESFDSNDKGNAFDTFCNKLRESSYTYSGRFNMTDKDIDYLMNKQKSDKLMFPLLSLLYPRDLYKYRNDLDIDHMHPISKKDSIPLCDDIDKIVNLKLLKGPGKNDSGSPGNRGLQDQDLIDKAKAWAQKDKGGNLIFTESDLLMGSDAINRVNKAYKDEKSEDNPLNSDEKNVKYFVEERTSYIKNKLKCMFVDFKVAEIPTIYDFM